MRTATPKQRSFIARLLGDIEALVEKVDDPAPFLDRITAVQSTIVQALADDEELSMSDASACIDVLLAVQRETKALDERASTPAGIAEIAPERWMPNRYANDCAHCGERVPAEAGYVMLQRGRWVPICSTCASTTADDRAHRLAEHRALVEAERERERALLAEVEVLAQRVLDAVGRGEQAQPNVGLAVPDTSGANDLLFYRLARRDRSTLYRVLGGRDDTAVSPAQAVESLRAMLDLDLPAAAVLYGREIGVCCLCQRTLTDEASRAAGIGPDCAKRF
jgi:hypothetical protein